jgi:hypothetical protein
VKHVIMDVVSGNLEAAERHRRPLSAFGESLVSRRVMPAENVGVKSLDWVIVCFAQIDPSLRNPSNFKDDRRFEVFHVVDPRRVRPFQAIFGGESK